jgi:hypothetical protein
MKKILWFSFALFLFGCSKDNNTSSPTDNTLNVKYEVICNVPVQDNTSIITVVDGNGDLQTLKDFTSGTKWTKTFTITTSKRPLRLYLDGQVGIKTSCIITGNLYINNVLKATNTTYSESQFTNGSGDPLIEASYVIQ